MVLNGQEILSETGIKNIWQDDNKMTKNCFLFIVSKTKTVEEEEERQKNNHQSNWSTLCCVHQCPYAMHSLWLSVL